MPALCGGSKTAQRKLVLLYVTAPSIGRLLRLALRIAERGRERMLTSFTGAMVPAERRRC